MNFTLKKLTIAGCILALGYCANLNSAGASPAVSTNVPLNSYVYEYLEKLDGLGYLDEMRTGNRPYSRSQVANWVQHMSAKANRQGNMPEYAKQMLDRLQQDFGGKTADFGLREIQLTGAYLGADTLSYRPAGMKASYQPLHINNNGLKYSANGNGILSASLEGNIGEKSALALVPRFHTGVEPNEADLEAAYLKYGINNLEVQLGKNELWWGQGTRGTLALSNNAEPFTGLKLSTLSPIKPMPVVKFLGPSHFSFFYAQMESERADVNSPGFVAMRADFKPSPNFTFGAARTSMLGGEGHRLSLADFWDFLSGTNADTAAADKWNSIGGFDFRWRMPGAKGIQLYGEIYGEDQAKMLIIPGPSKVAGLAGLYIPRLSRDGRWDAQLEWAQTTSAWYVHGLYQSGYVYRGSIIGDAMGTNAERVYLKVSHYLPSAASLSLNFERIVQDRTSATPQTINTVWLSARNRVNENLYMNASTGVVRVQNTNFSAGPKTNDYLLSLTLVHTY